MGQESVRGSAELAPSKPSVYMRTSPFHGSFPEVPDLKIVNRHTIYHNALGLDNTKIGFRTLKQSTYIFDQGASISTR